MAESNVDVIIVGAGLAGLAAADALCQATNGKVSFVVLECRDRVGGRTFTEGPDFLDMGAGYIGASQNYVQMMVERFSLMTFPQYLPDDKVWTYQTRLGRLLTMPGDNPYALPGGTPADVFLAGLDAQALLMRANFSNPLNFPDAIKVDAMSVQDWMDLQVATEQMSALTVEAMTVSVRSAFSVEPRDLGFLFLLYYAASAGGYSSLVDVTGGAGAAEATRFTYGTHSMVAALADAVGLQNIKLGTTVQSIAQSDAGVSVTTDKGVWNGSQVIVAMSPSVAGKLTYSPALETMPGGATRVGLCANMPMGRTIKGFMRYKSPFWRKNGQMGYMLSSRDKKLAPLDWTMDNSWEPTTWDYDIPCPANPYSLMTFIVGDAATFWGARTQAERAEAVIAQLVEVYGPQARSELLDGAASYVDKDWATTVSGGCPTGVMGPNTLTKYFSGLRTPIGRIHWAGSESADEWCGYMNGAIQSGMRAASEAITDLQK